MARPDFKLFVKKKDAKHGVQIGAGWSNDWGGISIKLNTCTVLTDRDDIYITLYPARDTKPQPSFDDPPPHGPSDFREPPLDDDNIPF
jgi:hypothetical protein